MARPRGPFLWLIYNHTVGKICIDPRKTWQLIKIWEGKHVFKCGRKVNVQNLNCLQRPSAHTVRTSQAFAWGSSESCMLTWKARNGSPQDSKSWNPLDTHQNSRIPCFITELKNLWPEASFHLSKFSKHPCLSGILNPPFKNHFHYCNWEKPIAEGVVFFNLPVTTVQLNSFPVGWADNAFFFCACLFLSFFPRKSLPSQFPHNSQGPVLRFLESYITFSDSSGIA